MFLRNFDNVCAVCNGVDSSFGDTYGDNSVQCGALNGNLYPYAGARYGNPIGFPLSRYDNGTNGSNNSNKTLALSFGSDDTEPTYEDYTYTTVTSSGFTRQNESRTTEYDPETKKYTVTLAMDFYNSKDTDVVAKTFVLRSELGLSYAYPFIFYKELLKNENGELAPITFPAKSYKHIEFKYTVQGNIYKPEGVTAI